MPLSNQELLSLFALILFSLGVLTFLAGIWVLLTRVLSKDVRTVTKQTAQMAKKGLSDNLAGVLNSSTKLLESMNQMVRTAAGIGVFLTLLGLLLIASGAVLLVQISGV